MAKITDKTLGARVFAYRVSNGGMSQAEFAKLAGIDRSTVNRAENGTYSLAKMTVGKIERVLAGMPDAEERRD